MHELIENWLKMWLKVDEIGAGLSLVVRIVLALVIVLLAVQIIRFFKKLINKALLKLKVDRGVAGFVSSLCGILLYIILGFSVATSFGVDAASVVAVLGSAGVTLGLAVQGSLSNLAGGLLIQFFRPFRVGDFIIEDSKGNQGVVKEIGLFYTHLEGAGGRIITLPNGTLANTSLTNVTPDSIRLLQFKVQVAYGSDYDKADKILREIMEKEPLTLFGQPVDVYITELQSDGVELEGRCYVNLKDFLKAKSSILHDVLIRFQEEGIEIPFPQLTLHEADRNSVRPAKIENRKENTKENVKESVKENTKENVKEDKKENVKEDRKEDSEENRKESGNKQEIKKTARNRRRKE